MEQKVRVGEIVSIAKGIFVCSECDLDDLKECFNVI